MHESVRICARERVSMLVLVQKTWMCWDCMFLTLTLQSIWPGKAGGSKTPRKRSQTQLVHLLVSSPKCASLFPVRHVLNRQNKVCTSKKLRKHRTKWDFLPLRDSGDLPCRWRRSERSLRPAAHLVALWRVCAQWSWGWRGQAGQYPEPRTGTSEDGRFCCSSHPPCAHKRGYLVIISYFPQRVISGASYLLRTRVIWVICSEVPPVILYQGKLASAINETEQHELTCPSPVCCWWWNKWGQSPSPADPESSERPGWWSSRWSDTPHRSGLRTGSAKWDKARQFFFNNCANASAS